MERMFKPYRLGNLELINRFVFPPIKLGYGNPDGTVTKRQLLFYKQIASNGPGLIILEPVAVTPNGREHPKQLSVHFPHSVDELKRIVDVIHEQNRLACLHLNHAGAAANPKATGARPKAPSPITCPTTGEEAQPLTQNEIDEILSAYGSAAEKAVDAGFDLIEIQGGHGYLVSQFLNGKINKRDDNYGQDRLLFAQKVLSNIKEGAPDVPLILRISGNEMSPEFGISNEDLLALMELAKAQGIAAIHVGMGNSCFSPPWYFHHGSLPQKPQMDALSWVRQHTNLPVIAAGRMGRKEKIIEILEKGLSDMVAVGRPLIADPELLEKWSQSRYQEIMYCGYCLQGCLHRLKNAQPLGCNLNPEIGRPPLKRTDNPKNVLVVGGGPAGMAAALYMSKRGHRVTLAEKKDYLGGQFALAWQLPGKSELKLGLQALEGAIKRAGVTILLNKEVDVSFVNEAAPDLLVWATGAVQNVPEIPGSNDQHVLTSLEYLEGKKQVKGPRVLVIGAGRVGLEISERLGNEGYEVVATKRTDPIGGMMEIITKKLALMRIEKMNNITIMPHTRVKAFLPDRVDIEKDGSPMSLQPFQTVILASGMLSAPGPSEDIRKAVQHLEVIGDAKEVQDIFTAIHSGYELAQKY